MVLAVAARGSLAAKQKKMQCMEIRVDVEVLAVKIVAKNLHALHQR